MTGPEPCPDRIAELERKLTARDKTIAALIQQQLESRAQGSSGLNLLEQNIALGQVVARKTRELAQERAELEHALGSLKATQARLLQALKLESIGQLAAGIAHEINTPTQYVSDNLGFLRASLAPLFQVLAAAQSVAQAARAGGLCPGLIAELDAASATADLEYLREQLPLALDQSEQGLGRIATIVKAMKEFSKPSTGTMRPENLEAIIRTAVVVAGNQWQDVADLLVDVEPGLPPVPCLCDEIGQLVLTLVINAAQAIRERVAQGGLSRGHIRISAARLDPGVELRFADDGGGIPEKIQDRVFDPFFTTRPVGEGIGQGLAIAYSTVVERHKGQIYLESEPGRGTCFIVRLPLGPEPRA